MAQVRRRSVSKGYCRKNFFMKPPFKLLLLYTLLSCSLTTKFCFTRLTTEYGIRLTCLLFFLRVNLLRHTILHFCWFRGPIKLLLLPVLWRKVTNEFLWHVRGRTCVIAQVKYCQWSWRKVMTEDCFTFGLYWCLTCCWPSRCCIAKGYLHIREYLANSRYQQ